jgi:GAF domain-containing protein
MLIDEELLLRNVASSSPRFGVLEDLQIHHGEGPCPEAYETKELVGSADLATDHRWPAFAPAAVNEGVQAVLASPIPYNREAVGVVAVFSSASRVWSPEGELALMAFTDLAALMIASTLQTRKHHALAEQLQVALDSRAVIEQAKGVLIARDHISARQAYEHLRDRARRDRRRLVDLAAEVVEAAVRAERTEV